MTTPPTEINAAAIKNGATEKHTPMMQQYFHPMKIAPPKHKATPKVTPDEQGIS